MPEYYFIQEPATMNINYQWWCLKCQGWHGTPYCPWDEYSFNPDVSVDNETYEICPHCRQIVKRQY